MIKTSAKSSHSGGFRSILHLDRPSRHLAAVKSIVGYMAVHVQAHSQAREDALAPAEERPHILKLGFADDLTAGSSPVADSTHAGENALARAERFYCAETWPYPICAQRSGRCQVSHSARLWVCAVIKIPSSPGNGFHSHSGDRADRLSGHIRIWWSSYRGMCWANFT